MAAGRAVRIRSALRRARDDRALHTGTGLLGSQAVVAGVSLVVNVASAAALGPGGRGELAWYTQMAFVVTVFCVLGADEAYPAVVTARPALDRATADVWRLVRWPSAVVVGCVSVAIAATAGPSRSLLAIGFAVFASMLVLRRVLAAASVATSDVRRYVVAVCTGQAVLLAASAGLLWADVRSVGAWLLVVGASGAIPLAAALLRRRSGRSDATPPGPLGGEPLAVRALGLRLVPAALLNLLLLRFERLILPALASYEELGVYIVVATMSEVVGMPLLYLVTARVPALAERLRTGTLRPRRILLFGLGYGVGGGLVGGAVSAVAVVPLFGQQYAAGVPLAVPLGLAAGIYAFSRVGAGICVAAHAAGWNTAMDLSGLVVGVLACVALAPSHGAAGAAIATICAYALTAAVSLYAVRTVVRRQVVVGEPRQPAGMAN